MVRPIDLYPDKELLEAMLEAWTNLGSGEEWSRKFLECQKHVLRRMGSRHLFMLREDAENASQS